MEGLKRTREQIGGIERFQLAKRVLCASIAERERYLCARVAGEPAFTLYTLHKKTHPL